MRQYRGYYIDKVIFHSEADIDSFLKSKAIEGFKTAVAVFVSHHTMEASIHCDKLADRLHEVYGMTYEEIEDIENSVFAAEGICPSID